MKFQFSYLRTLKSRDIINFIDYMKKIFIHFLDTKIYYHLKKLIFNFPVILISFLFIDNCL